MTSVDAGMGDTEKARLDAATKALIRERSQGLCDENYPAACDMCDCFHAETRAATGHGFTMERRHAQAVLDAIDAADAAAGIRRVPAGSGFSAKLGWSNPDTGPADTRLYATDRGESPRWARPRARVVEDALTEAGCSEGDRFLVIRLGDRFSGGAS